MKNKQNLLIGIYIMVIVLVGISVAYAALSTTLNITTNKITQSALTWSVGFTGTSATATAGGTSATGRSCGTATITSSSVTVADTTLSKPDDSCTYTLNIKNSGTIPAKLTTITPTAPSGISCTNSGASMVCGNITYSLATTSDGNTLLALNSTLAADATQTVYLIVKFTGSNPSGTSIVHSGGKFTLVYSQN